VLTPALLPMQGLMGIQATADGFVIPHDLAALLAGTGASMPPLPLDSSGGMGGSETEVQQSFRELMLQLQMMQSGPAARPGLDDSISHAAGMLSLNNNSSGVGVYPYLDPTAPHANRLPPPPPSFFGAYDPISLQPGHSSTHVGPDFSDFGLFPGEGAPTNGSDVMGIRGGGAFAPPGSGTAIPTDFKPAFDASFGPPGLDMLHMLDAYERAFKAGLDGPLPSPDLSHITGVPVASAPAVAPAPHAADASLMAPGSGVAGNSAASAPSTKGLWV
jgi:hypothetical protein